MTITIFVPVFQIKVFNSRAKIIIKCICYLLFFKINSSIFIQENAIISFAMFIRKIRFTVYPRFTIHPKVMVRHSLKQVMLLESKYEELVAKSHSSKNIKRTLWFNKEKNLKAALSKRPPI